MYMGKIVEIGETEELLSNPKHPYTKALLAAVPNPDPSYQRPEVEIGGSVTTPIDPHDRCRFFERCPMANDFCKAAPHPALEIRADGRTVACYRV
jgi:peptide/nickel transport system ATP-binding protein